MSDKCEHHDYTMVEDYIRGLQWSAEATDHEKSLVAGNIRGFYSHIRESLSTRPAESVAQGGESGIEYSPHGNWKIDRNTDTVYCAQDGGWCAWGTVAEYENQEKPTPTPATGSGGEGALISTTDALAALECLNDFIRTKAVIAPHYAYGTLRDFIKQQAHPAPAGGDAGEADHG